MTINHGANIFDLSKNLNISKDSLMDFSSNINPFGSSKKAKEAIINNIDLVSIYPDPEYKDLKEAISSYCKCNSENILLGSGATELISAFIKTLNPKKALLLSPSYSEYEKELTKSNCITEKFFAKKEDNFVVDLKEFMHTINNFSFDLVIICNPNNPTGFAFTSNEIKEILEKTNSFIMIDETYIEFTDLNKFSSTNLVNNYEKLFVIRGTSKFFSTPGIRLGYALNSKKDMLKKISSNIDLWNINIFATIMGEVMFKDTDYINETSEKLKNERNFLIENLKEINSINVFNSYGNFILCEIKNNYITSKDLYQVLLQKGIIIRDCTSFPSLTQYFFRVCILTHEENQALINNLKSIFK